MQGILCMPQNLQTGSPPPSKTIPPNEIMDMTTEQRINTKEASNQSTRSDSGIFSATGNSTFPEETTDISNRTQHSESGDTDNRSDCSTPDRKYLCPICEKMMTSQHEFTLHIRSHNNNGIEDPEKGFTCQICFKVLSSSSSLDRHVLVHSGERPFTCKYCGDTFTTNGNMHRHMRTHAAKNDNYESDGSSDSSTSSSSKTVEYNNNKIAKSEVCELGKKRKLEIVDENAKRIKEASDEEAEHYKCPVCERDDFSSVVVLEMHLQDNHPDYPAKCQQCGQMFKSNKLLHCHKLAFHPDENGKRNYIVGFKDLTYMDFSSQKFAEIARVECEKNFHKTIGNLKFDCSRCGRAFPCANSLEQHKDDCIAGFNISTSNDVSLDLSRNKQSENDWRRADFFSKLDLQNKSPERNPHTPKPLESMPSPTKLQQRLLEKAFKSFDGSKDLADIQSIISMTTNGSLLQHLQTKPSELPILPNHNNCHIDNSKHEEEESQDDFTAEFRLMKLRGEFPCRLCTAVFPNLRALKGHNRAHLNGNNNGTYRCNMCPHSSIDKAALIRHMRTHNGDRPYECSLCNYAFTTKANCERHLRNRHAKTTREEVKKAIIYHPSEDPTNNDINKLATKDEMKKLNLSIHSESNELIPDRIRSSTPKALEGLPQLHKIPEDSSPEFNPLLPITANLQALTDQVKNYSNVNEIIYKENLKSLKQHALAKSEQITPYFPPSNFAPNFSNTSTPQSKIQVKSIELLKQTPSEYNNHSDDEEYHNESKYEAAEEEPLDLVLDLSKKKEEIKSEEMKHNNFPEDLTKKFTEPPEILHQQLLKNAPKFDPSIYVSQLAMAYRNSFPGIPALAGWPGFPINPLLFQNPLFQDPQEVKERLQRQFCSGGMIMDNLAEHFKNMQHNSINHSGLTNHFNKMNDVKPEIKYSDTKFGQPTHIKQEDIKPLSLNIEQSYQDNLSKMQSPIPQPKTELMQSPNSVKMVIKNGVLMPKQKQRRYRTERPFSCEHCSARFTLRSNMERHIKQQHPQYWSQRQRSNIGTPGRKSQSLPGNVKNLCELTIPNYELPKMQDFEETKDQISDKIKYAILAQHLRATQSQNQETPKKDDDDDCALVIDEKDESKIDIKTEETNEKCENTIPAFPGDNNRYESAGKTRILEEKLKELHAKQLFDKLQSDFTPPKVLPKSEESGQDLVPVSRLLDNASQQPFKEYFRRDGEDHETGGVSEEDEEGLVASGSTSEGNNSGTDENRSESENANPQTTVKKKSAYSLAPNRVSCPYCARKFPWTSSLRRHILTHTGQKPFKCSHCPLLFTTKSNCDRHLLRKHGNSATTINNDISNNNTNYLMRNVPERPFKCSSCPSSTFSTYSNLKKHMSCKHGGQGEELQARGYEAGSSEDEKFTHDHKREWENQIAHSKTSSQLSELQNQQTQNSDLPFKCHLCEGSFADRQDALDHIKDKHTSEYELLMSKNALDNSSSTPDESNHIDEEENDMRGKFPDYSNRKVICAFCMRRFWSAEDLRRHMRTHTGERPFSCDICRRRFTLKHSMLRHRKKHNIGIDNDTLNSDEDMNHLNPSYDKMKKNENNNIDGKVIDKTDESDGNEGSDLISNLLGIRDRSIIDQVLTASADDAAKLLGVKNGQE